MFAMLMGDDKIRGVECGAAYLSGVRFFVVRVNLSRAFHTRRLSRAAKLMNRAGTAFCVFPKGFSETEIFGKRGVSPVECSYLYSMTASGIVEKVLEEKGILLKNSELTIAADEFGYAAAKALSDLAPKARAIALCVPHGGEELCERLRLEDGVSVRRTALIGERCGADILLSFGDVDAGNSDCKIRIELQNAHGAGVCVDGENMEVVYERPEATADDDVSQLDENQLIAAMLQSGALRAEALKVADIRFLLDTE